MNLVQAMRILYANEINCSIGCFWDGGWDVKLGDSVNGILATTCVDDPDMVGDWLIAKARLFFPNLDMEPK